MTPKEEVEGLLGDLLEFARKMLVEHGEFHPFGGYLTSSGNVVHMGVQMDGGGAVDRMSLLYSALQERADCAIACGVASNIWLPQSDGVGFDAVKVFFEHKDGYCTDVFCPYDLSRHDPLLVPEMFAQRGDSVFFAQSSLDCGR
ncbi:hypothetical protein [Stenotrophomonas sp. CFBP 13725]|uniref:hypothetical protein n=1 Tax=Stenotrophomonas sp. CFBP 13725 TaxID=2775297 RepID=UPI001785A34E|nr:hypothetical protein [Stenotrophomonas sp. CFBP 13725]MBD8636676.1 hypothetical protein [Stenotrophomonas sp. CFBP 13725]